MGGFHDILSKVISSIRLFVDHDIWSMRRLGDYDVWVTTTTRLKFVELRRNSSKFSRKRTRTNKNIKMSSYKSSENIQKKEGGPDRSISDNQSSSVTLNELAMKARKETVISNFSKEVIH